MLLLGGCDKAPEPALEKLRFGIIGVGSREQSEQAFGPLAQRLQAETGIAVEFVVWDSAEDLLRRYRAGGIEVSLMSGTVYRELQADPGAVPLVNPATDLNNATAFVARSDDPGHAIADFKGRRLAFGARESNSGHVMARRFLGQQGIEPEAFFGTVEYSAGHRETVEMVLAGRADLGELARGVLEGLRTGDLAHPAQWEIAPDLHAYGDRGLLLVLLENLLGNAWKFSARVRNPRIQFGAGEQGGELVFHVRDNGAGFDMRFVDKLFSAFQRLHDASEFDCTGIGLATVQRAVHRHGGHIRAEGNPGAGATFYFTLAMRAGARSATSRIADDKAAPLA